MRKKQAPLQPGEMKSIISKPHGYMKTIAVTPDPPKPKIKRPPAVYSNQYSPYGIAAELHNNKRSFNP
jgi:hypothetical protein